MTEFRHSCGVSCGDNCYLKVRWNPDSLGKLYEQKHGVWPFRYSGGKCSATDVDGVLERNGQILVVENKQGLAQVNTGQRIALEAFVLRGAMVLVQWCKLDSADSVFRFELWRMLRSGGIRVDEFVGENGGRLQRDELLARWWEWAERQGKPIPIGTSKNLKEAA